MKYRILSTIVLASLLLVGASASAETIERIVAKVNGKIITLTQLNKELAVALERMGITPDSEGYAQRVTQLREDLLNRMIDNMLVLQVAEDRGLRVPPRFFEEWKTGIMEDMKIETDEEFVAQIELQGSNMEALKEQFESGLLLQEVRRMEVDNKVNVTEPEIEARYQEHITEYTQPAKVRLREIVIRFDTDNKSQQAEKAQRILQDINQGADFAEMARMYSESGSREAGGDLGFFEEGELMDALAGPAFALSTGEVSEVITLTSAFYIIRVEERTEEEVKPMAEVRGEVADAIFNEKLDGEMQKYLLRLREQAIVEIKL